jgi:hypothetical protein
MITDLTWKDETTKLRKLKQLADTRLGILAAQHGHVRPCLILLLLLLHLCLLPLLLSPARGRFPFNSCTQYQVITHSDKKWADSLKKRDRGAPFAGLSNLAL